MEHNQCRLCLLPISKQINLFENSCTFNVVELINNLFNISILENDNFSNNICYACFGTLDTFNNYSEKVKLNNDYLIQNYRTVSCPENEPENNYESSENKSEFFDDIYDNDESLENDESDNNSENITENVEVILEESQESNDSEPYVKNSAKKKRKQSKTYPETANDIQIKKFYKYECDLCKDHDEISTFRLFKLHYKSKHGIAAYIKCCGKRFTRPYAIVEHIDEHLTPESLVCPTCNKKLRTKQTLLFHMDKHVPVEQRPLKCKYCDMRFVRNHFLHQHENVHLSEEQLKFICDLCGKRFPTDWRLKTHLNSTHSDSKPYVCEICAKSFKFKVHLRHHMFVHNSKEDAYKQCKICGIWLKSPKSYYVHMKDKHDDSAPKSFPCDKCSHVSPTRKALYSHSVNKHGPKKLNCTYCTESFSSSNLLKSHMMKHTGPGEPLKCPFCPKTFSFRSGYYSHKKKVHSDMTEPSKVEINAN